MGTQTFIIENRTDFEPKQTFECGQCFRWNKQDDGSYTGVFGNNVINVKRDSNKMTFRGTCEGIIIKQCVDYFDLDRNYSKIKECITSIDEHMEQAVEYGEGIRILNQDTWECLVSFIISANNNIPRIKKTIENICREYGKKIEYNGAVYYIFPTPEELSKASIEDLRKLGLGFRDKYVFKTTKMILDNKINLKELENMDIKQLRNKLMTCPGVGKKVADCVMLFSLSRFEVFPIDVWIKRVMQELYLDGKEVSIKEIQEIATEKYKDLAGIAQQYLFYWKRDQKAG
jgi:3-methyladenine DNA glycosylase/8-oxoguanine DNA glycosylase